LLIEKIAKKLDIDPEKLMYDSLLRWFEEEIAEIKAEIAEIMIKYNIRSIEELEKKIEKKELPEHPTWEDLITLENLMKERKKLEEGLRIVKESR